MLQAVPATVLRAFNGQVGLSTPGWALSTEAIMPQWHLQLKNGNCRASTLQLEVAKLQLRIPQWRIENELPRCNYESLNGLESLNR